MTRTASRAWLTKPHRPSRTRCSIRTLRTSSVLGRPQSRTWFQRPHPAPEDRKAGNLHGGQSLSAKGAEQDRSSETFEGRCDQIPRRAQC
eukprot:169076-Heterocapsa_arctica.AAC.1